MSQNQNSTKKTTTLTTEQVAEYLRINLEFFEKNPDLLSELYIPHVTGKGTTSLIERQLQLFRERNDGLKDQLKTFTMHAKENEGLWLKFKDLAVLLLKHVADKQLKAVIERALMKQYDLSAVVISIDSKKQFQQKYRTDQGLNDISEKAQIKRSVDFAVESLSKLFGISAKKVKSCALIPLKNGKGQFKGIMALGAENSKRFSGEQSTAYLECLSQLVSQALFQPNSLTSTSVIKKQ